MLTGRIGKAKDMPGWWWAECPSVCAYTQGPSREEALAMLADAVEAIGAGRIKVTVTEIAAINENEIAVSVACDSPVALAELVLQQQQ